MIKDLIGNKLSINDNKFETFSIKVKLNDDEPITLVSGIDVEKDFHIKLSPPKYDENESMYFEIISKNGDKIRIYGQFDDMK